MNRVIAAQSCIRRLWEFNILKKRVTGLNAKTTILENRAGNVSADRSVEDDLKRHFAVLYEPLTKV